MYERPGNEIMPPKNLFVSQFEKNFEAPRTVKRTSCGVAALTMSLNHLYGKRVDPTAVLTEFLSYGRYSRPTINAHFEGYDMAFPVLVAGSNTVQSEYDAYKIVTRLTTGDEKWRLQLNETVSANYIPTFTLGRGTDMRGIVSYLNHKDFGACLVEFDPTGNGVPISPNHILTTDESFFLDTFKAINEGGAIKVGRHEILAAMDPIILASIDMRDLYYPPEIKYVANPEMPLTHVLTVLPNRGNGVLYLDPAMAEAQSGTQVRPNEFFKKVLLPNTQHRGHFTVAWRNGG